MQQGVPSREQIHELQEKLREVKAKADALKKPSEGAKELANQRGLLKKHLDGFAKANLPENDPLMIKARELEELLSQPDDGLITQLADIKAKRSEIGAASRKLAKRPAIDSMQIMT